MLSGEPGATGAGLLGPVRGDSGFYTRDPRHNPRRVIIDTPVTLVRCSAPNRPPELPVPHDYQIGPILGQPVPRVGYALSAGRLRPFGS